MVASALLNTNKPGVVHTNNVKSKPKFRTYIASESELTHTHTHIHTGWTNGHLANLTDEPFVQFPCFIDIKRRSRWAKRDSGPTAFGTLFVMLYHQ